MISAANVACSKNPVAIFIKRHSGISHSQRQEYTAIPRGVSGMQPKAAALGTIGGFIRATALVILGIGSGETICADEVSGDEDTLDEIVVVGTHIRQADPEGPSPVSIFDQDALERSGAPTVAQVLDQTPFGNDGSFNDSDALSSAIGGSGISLRGLGANAVLVLINGRRVAPYGFSFESDTLVSFVDLNSIPIGAVDRIEVLKDGASAIYGADAIAGVINIVLKEGITGIEVEGRIGVPSDSGARETGATALWGHVGDRTDVQLIASYSDREALYWRDRAISSSSDFRSFGGPDLRALQATNFLIDDAWGAYGGECEERGSMGPGVQGFELRPDGTCAYDPNIEIAEPSVRRVGMMGVLNHAVRDNLNLHVETSFQDSEIENRTSPELYFGDSYASTSPWNPFGQSLPFAYAFTETGSAIDQVDTDIVRAVVALQGVFNRWVWEIGALYNRAVTSQSSQRGHLSGAGINAALNGVDLNGDGILAPDEYWNLYSSASNPNSQALADTLHTEIFRESETELFSIDGVISGDLISLPAGDLKGAIGFVYQQDSLHDDSGQLDLAGQLADRRPDPSFCLGCNEDNIVGPSFQVQELDTSLSPTVIGSREHVSVFGELQVPLTATFDAQLSLRHEDYSDFGSSTNPRIALRYQPWDRLILRGSWGESFRAPSLAELYLGDSAETRVAWDPLHCPNPGLVAPRCAPVVPFAQVTGGNPLLKPERSESVSLGFTAKLSNSLSLSANAWEIKHKDRIVLPGIDVILANETQLGSSYVQRNAASTLDVALGRPGTIVQVNNRFTNLARNDVRGFDVDATFVTEVGRFGGVNSRLLWTRLESSEFAFNPSDPMQELTGTYGHPKNRATVDTYLTTDQWLFGVVGRWTDGYDDTIQDRGVDSHLEWDLQVSNFSFTNTRISLGVLNVLDETPPYSVGFNNLQGFNTQLYRMRGRIVYGRLTVRM